LANEFGEVTLPPGCNKLVDMLVIADFCLIPIGIGVSVSREIAACERVLAEAGLKTRLHACGTNRAKH
jgi:hypothetical protein